MMRVKKEVKVVIGANYGDEGKGLMTDYFAREAVKAGKSSIVIRHSGGAQAGHTVETKDGQRFVFHHIGAGTLAGVPTYLSKYFLVNPIMYLQEVKELEAIGYPSNNLTVFVDVHAYLTTIYDIAINQTIECVRGNEKHGSCGLGISETVVRSENRDYMITIEDALKQELLHAKLIRIRDDYVPKRLTELGVTREDVEKHTYSGIFTDEALQAQLDQIQLFLDHPSVQFKTELFFKFFDTLIFEGSQGLLLDQDLEEFSPHITHTSTGTKNVAAILSMLHYIYKVQFIRLEYDLEVVYVSRTYLTRHGEGPLPHEYTTPLTIEDKTNVPNQWQGSLRYAPLNLDLLKGYIAKDLDHLITFDKKVSLALTWVNTLPMVDYVLEDKVYQSSQDQLIVALQETLQDPLKLSKLYQSDKPHAEGVTVVSL